MAEAAAAACRKSRREIIFPSLIASMALVLVTELLRLLKFLNRLFFDVRAYGAYQFTEILFFATYSLPSSSFQVKMNSPDSEALKKKDW
jgi:hypothetical protein